MKILHQVNRLWKTHSKPAQVKKGKSLAHRTRKTMVSLPILLGPELDVFKERISLSLCSAIFSLSWLFLKVARWWQWFQPYLFPGGLP